MHAKKERATLIKGAVANGSIPSQKVAQLLNDKSLDYIFIPTCRELNYLSIYVVCGYMLCR